MNRNIKKRFFFVPFYTLMALLVLTNTGVAQNAEPAGPGSLEYSLTLSNYTWVRTSDTIATGSYVEDLWADSRWNQVVGRGRIGIVSETGFDADYNTMAAMVDFGNNNLVGIVFPELSSVQIVAVPEPATASLAGLAAIGAMLWRRCC